MGLLFNTLTTNGMYLVLNREKITLPIQMQLSEKQKWFSQFFAVILKSIWNFEHFEKKISPSHLLYFSNYGPWKGGEINIKKISFQKTLCQAIWWTSPSTVEISIRAPLSYSHITAKSIELQKVSLIYMPSLTTLS